MRDRCRRQCRARFARRERGGDLSRDARQLPRRFPESRDFRRILHESDALDDALGAAQSRGRRSGCRRLRAAERLGQLVEPAERHRSRFDAQIPDWRAGQDDARHRLFLAALDELDSNILQARKLRHTGARRRQIAPIDHENSRAGRKEKRTQAAVESHEVAKVGRRGYEQRVNPGLAKGVANVREAPRVPAEPSSAGGSTVGRRGKRPSVGRQRFSHPTHRVEKRFERRQGALVRVGDPSDGRTGALDR